MSKDLSGSYSLNDLFSSSNMQVVSKDPIQDNKKAEFINKNNSTIKIQQKRRQRSINQTLKKDLKKAKNPMNSHIPPSLFKSKPLNIKLEKRVVEESTTEVLHRLGQLTETAQKIVAKKMLDNKIDYTKPLSRQVMSTKRANKDFVNKRRRTVAELLNYGMVAAQISEALDVSISAINKDIHVIRHGKNKEGKEVGDSILASYDKMLADLTVEYITADEASKPKIINSKMRTLESKWKYMLITGMIRKKKAGALIAGKDLAKMSATELTNTLKNIKKDTENIQVDKKRSSQSDLDVQNGEVKRLFNKPKVEIPNFLLEKDTDIIEDIESIEAEIKDLNDVGVS